MTGETIPVITKSDAIALVRNIEDAKRLEAAVERSQGKAASYRLHEFMAGVKDGMVGVAEGRFCPHQIPLVPAEVARGVSAVCPLCNLPPNASRKRYEHAFNAVLAVLGVGVRAGLFVGGTMLIPLSGMKRKPRSGRYLERGTDGDDTKGTFEDRIAFNQNRELVLLERLVKNEQVVVSDADLDDKSKSLGQLHLKYGLSRERIRQLRQARKAKKAAHATIAELVSAEVREQLGRLGKAA